MSRKRAPEPNHGQVGGLVPPLVAQACRADAQPDAVGRLMGQLHEGALKKVRSPKSAPKSTWKQWSPRGHGERASDTTLTKPAYTCVAKLGCGSVCVLRIDRKGNCSFAVRIKRSHWEHLAKAESLEEWSDVLFYHPLQQEEAVAMLLGARAFDVTVAKDCVHHPHALSLLCGMGRSGCLSKQCAGAIAKAGLNPGATFELVALPPSPLVVEECFCLLGHRATFKQQHAAAESDGEGGDDMPLSQHVVDASVWGTTHGATICDARDADRFKEAGQLIKDNDVAATLRHLPALNEHFANSAETLATLATSFQAWQDDHADLLAPSDAEDGPETPPRPRPPPPREAAPAAAAAAAATKPGKPKAPPPASHVGPKRPRAPRAKKDEDEDEEEREGEGESEASSMQASSEEESSDDDDDDDDDDGYATRRSKARRGGVPVAASATGTPTTPPPPPEQRLSVDALKAMSHPCCAHVDRWLRTEGRDSVSAQRREQLEADLKLLGDATAVEPVLAAALSLVGTLVSAHADPPPENSVRVTAAERKRVREMAAKTVAFAEAALGDVDRAIADSRAQTERLENLRKRSYDALEAAEGGGFGAAAAAPAAAAEATGAAPQCV